MLPPDPMFVCPECGRTFPGAGFCTEDGGTLAHSGGDPLLGQMVGSYRVSQLLGKGGMGSVYKGVHPSIGSRVAIKFLSQECAQHPALVERFFAEARAVNLIRHDNIVSVSDLASTPDGRPYIVMELLDGAPLSAFMKRYGGLPLGTLCRVLMDVLDGLDAAHAKGIVHRDLKPDNVFISPGGRVKILDFGIAKLRPDQGGVSDATRTGSLLGTPQYMSPEQAQGMHVDHRSDLYAAGVMLFEGATGQRPFPAQTLYELLKAHVEQMPPAPSLLRPEIPPALETVLLHALQKDPNYRYQSAQDFKAAIEQCLAYLGPETFVPLGEGVAARPPAVPSVAQGNYANPPSYAASGGAYAPAYPPAAVTPQPTYPSPYAPAAMAVPMGHAPPMPHPATRSYTWVWIVIGVFLLLVIMWTFSFCGACVIAAGSDSSPPAATP
ncbi:MAG: serine/threonine-protein kinase [Polyangiaceae bacterium]